MSAPTRPRSCAPASSDPRGQIEAAEGLALSRAQIYWHVVLLPAIEKVYPALTSQFVLLMLASSVCSQISAEELTAVANYIQSDTYRAFETYVMVGALRPAVARDARSVLGPGHDVVLVARHPQVFGAHTDAGDAQLPVAAGDADRAPGPQVMMLGEVALDDDSSSGPLGMRPSVTSNRVEPRFACSRLARRRQRHEAQLDALVADVGRQRRDRAFFGGAQVRQRGDGGQVCIVGAADVGVQIGRARAARGWPNNCSADRGRRRRTRRTAAPRAT